MLSERSTSDYYRALNWNRALGDHYTINVIRNPQNSIGNYLGPYSTWGVCPRSPLRITSTKQHISQMLQHAVSMKQALVTLTNYDAASIDAVSIQQSACLQGQALKIVSICGYISK